MGSAGFVVASAAASLRDFGKGQASAGFSGSPVRCLALFVPFLFGTGGVSSIAFGQMRTFTVVVTRCAVGSRVEFDRGVLYRCAY